jgi:hypothetical protein
VVVLDMELPINEAFHALAENCALPLPRLRCWR